MGAKIRETFREIIFIHGIINLAYNTEISLQVMITVGKSKNIDPMKDIFSLSWGPMV